MRRAEAIQAFHRASLAFSAMSIEVQGELHTIKSPSARLQVLESLARAEHALIAAHAVVRTMAFFMPVPRRKLPVVAAGCVVCA